VGIAYISLMQFVARIYQYKCVYVTAKIARQCYIGKT